MQLNNVDLNVIHEPGSDLFNQAVFGTNQSPEIELPENIEAPLADFEEITTHYNAGESENNYNFNRVLQTLNRLNSERTISRTIAYESIDLIPEAFMKRPINTYSVAGSKTNLKFAAEALGLKGWALIGLGLAAASVAIIKILEYFGFIYLSGGSGNGGGGGGGGGDSSKHNLPKKYAENIANDLAYVGKCREYFANAKITDKYATGGAVFKINHEIIKALFDGDESRIDAFTTAYKKANGSFDTPVPVNFDLFATMFIATAAAIKPAIYIEEAIKVGDDHFHIGVGNAISKNEEAFINIATELTEKANSSVSDHFTTLINDLTSEITKKIKDGGITNTVIDGLIENVLESGEFKKAAGVENNAELKSTISKIKDKYLTSNKFVLSRNNFDRILDVLGDNTNSKLSQQFTEIYTARESTIKPILDKLSEIGESEKALGAAIEALGKVVDNNAAGTMALMNKFGKCATGVKNVNKMLFIPVKVIFEIMGTMKSYSSDFKAVMNSTVTYINKAYVLANEGKDVSANTVSNNDIKSAVTKGSKSALGDN